MGNPLKKVVKKTTGVVQTATGGGLFAIGKAKKVAKPVEVLERGIAPGRAAIRSAARQAARKAVAGLTSSERVAKATELLEKMAARGASQLERAGTVPDLMARRLHRTDILLKAAQKAAPKAAPRILTAASRFAGPAGIVAGVLEAANLAGKRFPSPSKSDEELVREALQAIAKVRAERGEPYVQALISGARRAGLTPQVARKVQGSQVGQAIVRKRLKKAVAQAEKRVKERLSSLSPAQRIRRY